jgi:hypothetical protein
MDVLSAMLDEPEQLVSTLNNRPLRRVNIFGDLNWSAIIGREIRICPACIQNGRHTKFAEFKWLRLCPFHGTEHLVIDSLRHGAGAAFDSYVDSIAKILTHSNSNWPSPPAFDERRSPLVECGPLMHELLDWISRANRSIDRLGQCIAWISQSAEGQPVDNVTGFSRLLALCPPEKSIRNLFAHDIPACRLVKVCFDDEVTISWNYLTKQISPHTLVHQYNRLSVLSCQSRKFQDKLEQALEMLRHPKMHCECEWGWSRYSGWQRVGAAGWPQWGLQCPYDVAKNELIGGWGEFREVMTRAEAKRTLLNIGPHDHTGVWREKFSNSEMAGLAGRYHTKNDGDRIHPLRVSQLVDTLLCEEVCARAQHLKNWLVSLEQSAAPNQLVSALGDVVLVHEGAQLRIFSWHTKR